MRKNSLARYSLVVSATLVLLLSTSIGDTYGEGIRDVPNLYEKANEHFMIGEYHEAIELYDKILEISPSNAKTSLMKGIALDNLERHKASILEFYKVNQQDPENITALIGLGVGFGNYGEYKQALTYFEQAYELAPENHVVENYYEFALNTVKKYPYNEAEKPEVFTLNIPQTVPAWIKNTAGWWATDKIPDEEFLKGINFLIDNGLLVIDLPEVQGLSEEKKKINDRNQWEFSRYLDRIQKIVDKDKRYIEYPNPSNDVIKKFLRDYVKWNYDQQIEVGNQGFPNPEYVLIDDVYHLEYKIYVNDQPPALPLDHVSTLTNSFKMWEDMEFNANDGKKVKINFVTTNTKTNANLWVTWVVRDLGEGVLGHANLGKGIVEVALGGYGCDGNFQLFHVNTVEYIMTHELGHGIGLKHSKDPNSIMYPSMKNTQYAYCMLDVDKKINTGSIVLKKD
ncbi:MAG: M57 family metalloprotease [Thermoproteota archaeon]|nr:M57 family metalloprotease [Thermoproteota archaeon]MEC9087265.1 M57 family metalloprotease [Thermoproteota archaeon]